MKTLNFKSFLLSSLLLAATVSCVEEHYDAPNLDGECVTIPVTKQVVEITSTSVANPTHYTADDVIEAYVTSSDEAGNFYKSVSFVSVDGAVGFSMPIDAYNTYTYYEPGRKVFIKMKDLYYQTKFNSTVIGAYYDGDTPSDTSDDSVGRIAGVDFKGAIKASCDKVNEDDIVKHVTISQAKNDANLNKLIEFDNVQFSDESVGKKYFDPSLNNLGGATNHQITDEGGAKIILRVSEFASFASDIISNKSGKIRGVLTKFNNDYQFMVRSTSDIKLTNARSTPLFEEPFTTNFASWTKFSVTGAQVWNLSATGGNPTQMARMNGFASGVNNVNEDWLISPAINLASVTTAKFAFDNSFRFAGNTIQVYVSSNYVPGSNPNTATWTEMTGLNLDTNPSAYVWTNSGLINVSAYAGGNLFIAFKYTSTSTSGSQWQIDNVRVIGN